MYNLKTRLTVTCLTEEVHCVVLAIVFTADITAKTVGKITLKEYADRYIIDKGETSSYNNIITVVCLYANKLTIVYHSYSSAVIVVLKICLSV